MQLKGLNFPFTFHIKKSEYLLSNYASAHFYNVVEIGDHDNTTFDLIRERMYECAVVSSRYIRRSRERI